MVGGLEGVAGAGGECSVFAEEGGATAAKSEGVTAMCASTDGQ